MRYRVRPKLATVIGIVLPWVCSGDGGALILRQQVGERIFSVFASPAQIAVGPVEVSVLIEGEGGAPMVGESVEIAFIDGQGTDGQGTLISKAAAWGGGGNAALADTKLTLPHAGDWTLRVRSGGGEVSERIGVVEGRGRFQNHWGAWAFVPVLLALFLWHQWLTLGAKQAIKAGRSRRSV